MGSGRTKHSTEPLERDSPNDPLGHSGYGPAFEGPDCHLPIPFSMVSVTNRLSHQSSLVLKELQAENQAYSFS